MTYEKILERAKEYYYDGGTPEYTKFVLEDIFPELKESEDEKTCKWIIMYLQLRIHYLFHDSDTGIYGVF